MDKIAEEVREIKKMSKAVINHISTVKSELLMEIKKSRDESNHKFEQMNKTLASHTKRLDRIGRNVVFLEEDTPTRDEFDRLESRVLKVENRIASN